MPTVFKRGYVHTTQAVLFAAVGLALFASTASSQTINGLLVSPPSQTPLRLHPATAAPSEGMRTQDVLPSPPITEAIITTETLARAAIFADDTHLDEFAEGTFVPSAIPVAGHPFFGTGTRANLQGS